MMRALRGTTAGSTSTYLRRRQRGSNNTHGVRQSLCLRTRCRLRVPVHTKPRYLKAACHCGQHSRLTCIARLYLPPPRMHATGRQCRQGVFVVAVVSAGGCRS